MANTQSGRVATIMAVIIAMLALAAATLWASPVQAAGTGMPMLKSMASPLELAKYVEDSLKVDSTGNKILDLERCKKNGSCATARDYFIGISKAHPSAKLGSITELPRYLRSLVMQPAPKGQWYMARLLVKGNQHKYDGTGWHREFFEGEVVYDDPNTGEHILASACGNVVGVLFKQEPPRVALVPMKALSQCLTVEFTVKPGDEVRFTALTKKYFSSPACLSMCDGSDCHAHPAPCDTCNWGGPMQVIPPEYVPLHSGMYIAKSAVQRISFPLEVANDYVALCTTREGEQSNAWVVQPSAWKGKMSKVVVPYGGQQWPSWGDVDMSKWPQAN